MRRGKLNQFIDELEDKIAELKGVESAQDVECKTTKSLRQHIVDIQKKLDNKPSKRALFSIVRELMRYNRDTYGHYLELLHDDETSDAEIAEMIAQDLENELNSKDNDMLDTEMVEGSAQIIDDGTDVIEADEDTKGDHDPSYKDVDGILGELNAIYTMSELKDLYDDLYDDDPIVSQFDTFEAWFDDMKDSLIEVEALDSVMSDEEVEVEDEHPSDDAPAKLIVDAEETEDEDDKAEYITGLYASVEKELNDLAESISWNSDEDNIYMDISFADGHVFTFTIPKADLAFDIENMGNDIEYICHAVHESQELEADYAEDYEAPYNMEDYYAEEDRPAYL